jgi:organic hydroperoxide reductase OsmC/OhrA
MMGTYNAETLWTRGDATFTDGRYSRRFTARFDGGLDVAGSASPHVVPVPMSDPSAVDPEEAFVSSLSSCHMLWFLSIAAKKHYCVDRYHDRAEGTMAKNADGKLVITRVTLRPHIEFSGDRVPDAAGIAHLHELAHAECFLANSVRSEVVVEPPTA